MAEEDKIKKRLIDMGGESYDSFEYKDISELKKELEGIRGKKEVSNKELYEAVQKLAQVMGGIVEVFGAAAEQMNLEEKELESSAKKHEMIMAKLDKLITQNKAIAEGMLSVADIVRGKMAAHAKEEDGKDSASALLKQRDEQERPQSFAPLAEPDFFKPLAQQDWQPNPARTVDRAGQITPLGMPAMSRQGDSNEMRIPNKPSFSNIATARFEQSDYTPYTPTGRFERSENISRGQHTMAPPMMPAITIPPPTASTPFQGYSNEMRMPNMPILPDFGMQMPPMEPAPPPALDLDLDEALSSLEQEPKKKGLFGMFKKS